MGIRFGPASHSQERGSTRRPNSGQEGMTRSAIEPLRAGREAITRHAWREAFDLLTEADASGPLGPQDLESLAEAAWWTGRLDHCIDARQRAYSAHVESGNHRQAAMVALAVAKDYYAKQASAVGTAWLNRGQRLLEREPESLEHGYLERMRCVLAFEGNREFDQALDHATRAFAIGSRFADRDLMAASLHDRGRILVAKGQVADGMALMDEATVAAVGGELGPYWTAAIYCNTITACRDVADYGRAAEWSDAAKRWCERQAITGFPGMCRVYRAELMRLRGSWQEAEQEARRACQELKEFNLGYTAEAFYEVGEIRLRTGDLAGAEQAFSQAHELGRDPQPGLSLLQLAQGKAEAATASIDRALRDRPGDRLGGIKWSSQHLELEVDVWDDHGVGHRRRQGGRRCDRQAGRRSRGGSIDRRSGRRSLGARRARMPGSRLVCHRPSGAAGSVKLAACQRRVSSRTQVAISRSRSARRSRSVEPTGTRYGRSPGTWAGHRPRSRGSCAATRRPVVDSSSTGRPSPSGIGTVEPLARKKRSWP